MEELLLASEVSEKDGDGTGWVERYSGGGSDVSSHFKCVLVWLASNAVRCSDEMLMIALRISGVFGVLLPFREVVEDVVGTAREQLREIVLFLPDIVDPLLIRPPSARSVSTASL